VTAFVLLSRRSPAVPFPPGSAPVPGGCAAVPHACGFPDATNTGVPRGTRLRKVPGQVSSGPGWYFDARGWVQVDRRGTVLSGLSIPCNVNVAASDVTIRDDRIAVAGNTFGVSVRHTRNVTIEDSTISGLGAGAGRLMVGIKDIYADSTGLTVLRNNISEVSTGVQMESGLVASNYIHDMGYVPGDHTNGITSNGGRTGRLTVRYNTIFTNRQQTDAIGLFEDFGTQANRIIDDNLLAGGGYAIYGGQNPGGPATSRIVVENNRISRIYYPDGGFYGPAADFDPHAAGNIWSGNVWDRTGSPVVAP